MLAKKQNWRQLLVKFAESEVGAPFVWGQSNCVALALRAIDVQCGSDLLVKYSSYMRSERRAALWSAKNDIYTGGTLVAGDGLQVIGENYTDDGDIMLIQRGREISAHVLVAGKYLSSTKERGVRLYPAKHLDKSTGGLIFLGVR